MVGVLGVDLLLLAIFFPRSPPVGPLILAPNLPGVGLCAYRGPPITLLDSFGPPIEGRTEGVETAFCVFRRGDSGRGNDGLDLGLKSGLRARPGPTDWLNFEFVDDVGV